MSEPQPQDGPRTIEELREAQRKEYGTYIAAEPINIDGVRAFNLGDPVPVGHVERGVVRLDQVAKRATKAGAAIQDQSGK